MTSVKLKIKSAWGYVVEYTARDATALAHGNGYDGDSKADGLTRNALAHAHKSAELYYDYGEIISKTLGEAKELLPGGDDPKDKYKDEYNNEVGRRIAEYAKEHNLPKSAIDDLMMDALKDGKLIVDPEADDRVSNQTPPDWTEPRQG